MNRSGLISLAIMSVFAVSARGAAPTFDMAFYRGTIAGTNAAIMQIDANEGEIKGGYFYESKGAPIDLVGTVAAAGTFEMHETVDDKDTGKFVGSFKDDRKHMDGEWKSPDGKRSLPFSFTRFAIQHEDSKTEKVESQSIESGRNYPVFENPSEKSLNDAVVKHLDELYKSFVAMIKKAADPKGQTENNYDVDVDVAAYTPGSFVSLVFTISLYAGGAHGTEEFDTLNLRLSGTNAPKVVGFADLFTSEGTAVKAISDYCIAELKKQKAGFVVDGIVKSLNKEALSHYTLTSRGMTILFQPYAVASYADGPSDVTLPYSVLKPQLKDGALDGIGIAAPAHP